MPLDVNPDANGAAPRAAGEVKPFNKFAALLGVALLVAGAALYFTSSPATSNVIVPNLLIAFGLGFLGFAAGDEAKLSGTGFTIIGATAIGAVVFLVLEKATKDRDERQERMYAGQLTVFDAAPEQTGLAKPERFAPAQARLQHNSGSWNGTIKSSDAERHLINFSVRRSDHVELDRTECPTFHVTATDGKTRTIRFKNDRSFDLSSLDLYFDIIYYVKGGRVYYRTGRAQPRQLSPCDDSLQKDVTREIAASETNTDKTPAIDVLENKPLPARQGPASPPVPPPTRPAAAGGGQLVGYVLVSERSTKPNVDPKTWFETSQSRNSRFPAPNEVIVVSRKVAMRPVPYHWNDKEQKHVREPREIATLQPDTRVVVGGDAIVAHDENRDLHLVYSPVAAVVGQTFPAIQAFNPRSADDSILGYVYGGSVDEAGGDFTEKIFDNITRPDAIYPAPNDILVARSNVWLRTGPRRWEPASQRYVNADTVRPVKNGQHVRVSGDTVLARGGLSIWIPIDRIADTFADATLR